MLRILHVLSSPNGIGGAERIVLELLAAGQQEGWEQRVVNLFGPNRELNSAARTQKVFDVVGRTYLSLHGARKALISQFEMFRPDVTHAHLFHAGVICSSLPNKLRKNLLLTHHHGDIYEVQGRAFRTILDRWAARRFPNVVAVSIHTQKFLAERYGLGPDALRLIRNGCRTLTAIPEPAPPTTLVCVAGFRPEKGHDTLLKATALLQKDFPNLRVLLVGDGPLRPEIEETIGKLGLSDHVRLVGWVEDVEMYFGLASIAVVPSLIEQFGLGVLEAMGAGIPVVATKVGGIPELITNHENGILVPPGDPYALAEGIRELLTSPRLAEQVKLSGRSTAAALSISRTVQDYHALYRQIAKADIRSNGSKCVSDSTPRRSS